MTFLNSVKTSLFFPLLLVSGISLSGQGTVNFSNIGLPGAQIFDASTGAPVIAGNKFTVGLYWAVDGTTDESAFQLAGATTGIAGAPGTATGLYSGGTRTVDITPPGFFAMFQVRLWETAFGSYANAIANGGLTGKSGIVRVDTGDPTTIPPGTPASLKGISGFCTVSLSPCVPEPSLLALLLLGAASLLFLRSTKRKL